MVENGRSNGRNRRKAFLKTVAYTVIFSAIGISGWTTLRYFQNGSLQGIVRESIQIGLSSLQVDIAFAGLTGLVATVLAQRRLRSKRVKGNPLRMTKVTFGTSKPVHPLMMTQRPARDKNFVIRKTRNRGRISRNRKGERLPPSYMADPGVENAAE